MNPTIDVKIVNETIYELLEVKNSLCTVKATIGGNGVKVVFACLYIEWENDFIVVQNRLKEIITTARESI